MSAVCLSAEGCCETCEQIVPLLDLLCNNNMATNLHVFTPSYGSSSVATAIFFTRSGFFLFYLGLWGFLLEIWVFLTGQILEMYVVFSIQVYSNFTGVMCGQ